MTAPARPVVSVVTPFYNTAEFLRECIQSVLAQTFGDFEYLLVNNCSTDGSDRIALEYARLDPRIRVVHNQRFVGQVENYNGAVTHISPDSRYVKVVQADDWIYPECLARMVALAEAHPSVVLVGSYYLEGNRVQGWGVPPGVEVIAGRETCRGHMLGTYGFFGSPTTLLYRADLVRRRQPLYAVDRLHEDSELCFEALRDGDFGFVHQVLSFMRTGNQSILSGVSSYNWRSLDAFLTVRMFGPEYLTPSEYAGALRDCRGHYLGRLAEAALLFRERAFWEYQRKGLATIGDRLRPMAILPHMPRAALKALVRPRWALDQLRARSRASAR
jgi:glycosyltransferase involved in cell wall biosynthesis